MQMTKIRGATVGTVFALMMALAPATSQALEPGSGRAIGLGLGAAGANFLYIPAKLLYAGTGTLVGGLAWAFAGGDNEVSDPIFTASWLGDYVLTADHLAGKQPIEFIGRPYSDHQVVGEKDAEPTSQDDSLPAVSEGF